MHPSHTHVLIVALCVIVGTSTGCLFVSDANQQNENATDAASDVDWDGGLADASIPDGITVDLGDTMNDTTPFLSDPPNSVCPENGDISGLTQISAGAGSVCGLTGDRALICWGRTSNGLFGDVQTPRSPPRRIANRRFDELDLGISHACAVETGSGLPYCWGTNQWSYFVTPPSGSPTAISGVGKAVPGSTAERVFPPQPVELPDGPTDKISSISVGQTHTCAIDLAGQVVCWGSDRLGQLGNGSDSSQSDRPIDYVSGPTQESNLTGIDQIAAGGYHSCASRKDPIGAKGDVFCWGSNARPSALQTTSYQIGFSGSYDSTEEHIEPMPVSISGKFPNNPPFHADHLTLSHFASCSVHDQTPDSPDRNLRNEVHCWGDNTSGQSLVQTNPMSFVSNPKRTLNSVGSDIIGEAFAFDSTTGGACAAVGKTAYCWGDAIAPDVEPGKLWTADLGSRVADITLAEGESGDGPEAFACALLEGENSGAADNSVVCWGYDVPQLPSGRQVDPATVSCS